MVLFVVVAVFSVLGFGCCGVEWCGWYFGFWAGCLFSTVICDDLGSLVCAGGIIVCWWYNLWRTTWVGWLLDCVL